MFMGDAGSMLIGLVLVGVGDHPDRPVLRRPSISEGGDGAAGQPAAGAAAAAAADRRS